MYKISFFYTHYDQELRCYVPTAATVVSFDTASAAIRAEEQLHNTCPSFLNGVHVTRLWRDGAN